MESVEPLLVIEALSQRSLLEIQSEQEEQQQEVPFSSASYSSWLSNASTASFLKRTAPSSSLSRIGASSKQNTHKEAPAKKKQRVVYHFDAFQEISPKPMISS